MSAKSLVLVVDDMQILRDPIAASLRLSGYETACASNGAEALRSARTRRPDLILLDVSMPVMDGLAFLRALRGDAALAGVPVVLLTALSDKKTILEAGRLGVKEYLLKSRFSLADMLGRVKKTLAAGPLTQSGPGSATPTSPRGPGAARAAAPAAERAGAAGPVPSPVAERARTPQPAAALRPVLTREQCLARAEQAMQAKTLSGAVTQVIAAAASSRGSVEELSQLISRDPVLSSRLLQLANSASYSAGRPVVSNIPDAVRQVGNAAVRNIAAAIGVFDAMPSSEPGGFNPIRCWQHSFAVALLCEHLAGPAGDAGVAYLAGLCHDLGEILFHTHFSAEFQHVALAEAETGKPRAELERQILGMTQGELAATILRCLKLPDIVRVPIERFHSSPALGRPTDKSLVDALRLADLYANGLLLSSSIKAPVRPVTHAECRAATGDTVPARPDAAALRSKILGMTGMLARLSPNDEAELMKPCLARRAVRVWFAREPALSPFDPLATALESLAEVNIQSRIPNSREELGDCQALVVAARTDMAACLTGPDIARAACLGGATPLPVLWLVGQQEDPVGSAAAKVLRVPTVVWPVSLDHLANFVGKI